MRRSSDYDRLSQIALAQGFYYVVTGLWAVADRRSFEWVTGPKTDYWLVRATGGLFAATGGSLAVSGFLGSVTPDTRLLGASAACVTAAADVFYGLTGRIRKIYLLDSLVEIGFLFSWLTAGSLRGDDREAGPDAH